MPIQCTIDSNMSDRKSSISRMDHTPGRFCYKGIGYTVGPLRRARAVLFQAIHDERDPARAHELKAEFFSLEDKSNYQIRLPLHCNYVSLPLGQADWHSILMYSIFTIYRAPYLVAFVNLERQDRIFDLGSSHSGDDSTDSPQEVASTTITQLLTTTLEFYRSQSPQSFRTAIGYLARHMKCLERRSPLARQ
jgi:hypothetical protein